MKVTDTERRIEREKTGMQDGKHHLFNCLRCNAPLCEIWVNYPNDNLVWRFIAKCDHCGGESGEEEVRGSFVMGPSEESEPYTVIESYDIDSDPIIIYTKKREKYEQKRGG